MSIEALAIALHHGNVTGTAKVVLLGIANHDGDGGAYPTIETLGRYAGVADRNVQKALSTLVSKGLVRVHYEQGGDRDCPDGRRPNRYELLVRCPEWCDRTTQHRDTRRNAGAQLQLLRKFERVRVTESSPQQLGRGDASVTPTGDAGVTQTTHPTQPPSSTSQPQTAREAPCSLCGKGELACQRQQTRWADADRHPYQPLAVRHASG